MADKTEYECAVAAVRAGAAVEDEAARLYDLLSDDERLWLLDGDTEFWQGLRGFQTEGYNRRPVVMGAIDRLGIPGLRFTDGPRGVVMGNSTAFPVAMARGASWDVDLEQRIGDVIGLESVAQGANFFAGVCINLLRHPAWGRAQETYGEDPHLLGEFGAALTRGVRAHVMACAKHYALNSMENARFTVDVIADDAALHEIYLPHFRRVVEEGVDGIMTAYNAVNGEWAGHSRQLIGGILRGQWGFEGVTISDFVFGIRDAADSLEGGLDVEAPFRQHRALHLRVALAEGRTSWDAVRRAALHTLGAQLRYASAHQPRVAPLPVVACDEHRDLARTAAARAMVLLRNEDVGGSPVLPLHAQRLHSLAVIGRLADLPNLGDHGSSDVRAPQVITALAGLRAALPHVTIVHVDADDALAAAAAAAGCDAAIIVAGYTAEDEGEFIEPDKASNPVLSKLLPPPPAELAAKDRTVTVAGSSSMGVGGDRERLTLRPVDEEIIRAVAAANPRTVVAVVAAGAVLMESWRHQVPGIVMAWYSGMEGGHALADVLLGGVDAAGRLPFSIPTDAAHLPPFDRNAKSIVYDAHYGQRLLDELGVPAAYPLGFGLSYTNCVIEGAQIVGSDGEHGNIRVQVANPSVRDGRHIVQVYGRAGEQQVRSLVGFAAVAVAAGSTVAVDVPVSLRPLMRWNADAGALQLPDGVVALAVGNYSGDPDALQVTLR